MRAVIQRVKKSSVEVEGNIVGEIGEGLLVLVGVTHEDVSSDVDYLVKKIANMRIFEDEFGKMNLSLLQKGYDILSVSQFTLFGDTKKGNRPSFTESAKPQYANEMYMEFNEKLRDIGIKVEVGIFGADMDVSLINDGPVTIILDSKNR